jgi:HSP20 family protein
MSITLSSKENGPARLSTINIDEAEQEYVLYVAAPGMQREDISVSVEKGIITIIATGNKKEVAANHSKYNSPAWKKSFILPQNADPLLTAATCINGELRIHIPKGDNTEERPLMIHVY